MPLVSILRRSPAASYFALCFLLSWSAVLAAAGGPGGIPANGRELATRLPLVVLALTLGPFTAGLFMTGVTGGRDGFKSLVRRLLTWRVGLRWYVLAVLALPVVSAATLALLSLSSAAYAPGILSAADKPGLLVGALVAGLAGGLLEEPGWTGFAAPTLRRRRGLLTSGLAIGAAWGAWHLIAALWGSGTPDGVFSFWMFLPQLLFYALVLPAFRVLMVWVHDRTGSLPVAMLMHASLTGGVLFIFMPAGLAEGSLSVWYLSMAGVLWLAVAVLAAAGRASGRKGSQQFAL